MRAAWTGLLAMCWLAPGCPSPEYRSNSYSTISDTLTDIRALIPGAGGHDPYTGLPVPGEGACKVVEVQTRGDDREERRTYDEAGRLVSRRSGPLDAPVELETRFEWGEDGAVLQIESSYKGGEFRGSTLSYEGGVLVGAESDDTETAWTYSYDEAGRVKQMVYDLRSYDSSGYTLDYAYDEAGRLASKQVWRSWGLWMDILYDYDEAGQVASKTFVGADRKQKGDIVEVYTWAEGRITRVARAAEGWSDDYEYDDEGRLSTISRTYIPKKGGDPQPEEAYVSRVRRFEWGCTP